MMDEVLKRKMFSDPAAGGVQTTPEQEAQMESFLGEIAGGLQETNKEIDDAEDYVGIMNAIRGDKQSIEQRRTELASYIGKEDANATPESALTLVQPTFSMIEASEQGPEEGGPIVEQGIVSVLGDLGSAGAMGGVGSMQAPRQGEAIARMAMGEQPVMRQDGTPQTAAGGENIGKGTAFDTVRALQGLVPEPTSYETYLSQYQDLLGSDKTGFELNPYISGLNLAAAVANAPKGGLISSILAPETVKAVSDPILQMAQAKSKTEQAIKLKAAEAAAKSKSDTATAKSDILTKAIPELLKGDDFSVENVGGKGFVFNKNDGTFTEMDTGTKFETVTLADGRIMIFDPFNPEDQRFTGPKKANPLVVAQIKGKDVIFNPNTGGYTDASGAKYETISLGDGRVAMFDPYNKNDVTYLGTAKGENKFDAKPVVGGALVFNKQTGHTEFKAVEGLPIDFTIHGNAERGFFKMSADGAITPLTTAETGVTTGVLETQTELVKNIKALNEARTALRNMSPNDEEFANTLETVQLLAANTTPLKGSEFERIVAAKADSIYNNTAGTEADKEAAKNAYLAKTHDEYVEAKTTVKQNYNPNEALDKEFAGLFGKQVEAIGKGADNAAKLSDMADLAVIASERFTPGAFADARLTVIKMVQAVGGEDRLRSAIGEENYNNLFSSEGGNHVASGELLKNIGAQFAVMMAESFPGNLNQSEVNLIIDASTNIGVSKAGLKTLQTVFEAASNRAKLEAKYSSDFLQDDANRGLGAEAKYAKFNDGLRLLREDNPVITRQMVENLEDSVGDQATVQIPADVASGYTTTQSIERDFDRLQDDYPTIFVTDLPPANAPNNARQIALQRILESFQRISQ